MKVDCEIAGIRLGLDYIYPDYFCPRIERYMKFGIEPDHQMVVKVTKHIDKPSGEKVLLFKDRYLLHSEGTSYIVKENEKNEVTDLVRYDTSLKNVEINLLETIGKRLPTVEYLLTGMMYFEMALAEGKIPIHASAIAWNGEAILFSASSGTGKSTQAA
ncbi:MAG TPA: hypothetical protein P5042_05955, partial [Candidatus Izemoplasmatales bacterium]|nr:hypothetical protein [Candidatus Izemoplasmatales bacterium]